MKRDQKEASCISQTAVRIFVVAASILFFASLFSCGGLNLKTNDEPQKFSFAWLSDTHIVTTDKSAQYGDRAARLERAIEEINARKDIDFIVFSGDLIENVGTEKQFDAFDSLVKTGKPVYYIPGNHDIDNDSKMANVDLWLKRGYGKGNPPKEYYGFTHKGAAFFVINTFAYQSKDPQVQRRAAEQMDEMNRFFSVNSSAKCKIVCGHAPLYIKYPDEADEYFNIKKDYREKFLAAMRKNGAGYYLCGHRHGEYVAGGAVKGDAVIYTQGAMSWAIGEGQKTGYSIFTFAPGENLKKQFIPLD